MSIKALGCIVTSIAGIPDKQNVSYGHEVKEAVVYGSIPQAEQRWPLGRHVGAEPSSDNRGYL